MRGGRLAIAWLSASIAWLAASVWAVPARGHSPGEGLGPMAPAASESWNGDPWTLLPLLCAAVLYAVGLRRLLARGRAGAAQHKRRALWYAGGWLAAALALLSPIDALGAELFSMHMVQHELLMLFAAPALVVSAPGAVFAWSLPQSLAQTASRAVRALRGSWRALTRPLPAWSLHALALWGWHAPSPFDAALASDLVHTLQHASFLLAAIVFWWSVRRDAGGLALLSLFTTALHATVLGFLLTLSARVWYASYLVTAPRFGLTALEDQQLGGLIMWMPGGIVFLAAGLWLLRDWIHPTHAPHTRHLARGTRADAKAPSGLRP